MKSPLRFRKQIPFFYDKSEKEIQQDPYERFDPMVIRQSALHLADELWGAYPMQDILAFSKPFLSLVQATNILEIGCGVGRWIATLAQAYPEAECWGIDYSYQMLKRAQEVWVDGKSVALNLAKHGFSATHQIQGIELANLHFGLSKASLLPFADQSQDLVVSSFLFDRLEHPISGIQEMQRVLRPDGILLLLTPLNFNTAKHWEQFYPPIKIHQTLIQMGFEILDWQEEINITEPLDLRGNAVHWKCIGLACKNNSIHS